MNRLFHAPYLLLALAALFWAGNAVAGKAAVGTVPPMALAFLRWTAAAIILSSISTSHLKRDWPQIRRNWLLLGLQGALGFGAFNLLLYSAVHFTSAINVAIEQSAIPVTIILLGFIMFREPASLRQIAGVALALAGVAITASYGDLNALLSLKLNRGDVLMLGAILVYSGYTISLKRRPEIHWLSFLTTLSVAAALTSLPFFLYEMSQGIIMTPSIKGLSLIAYVALLPSLAAQFFFARGVEIIGPNRAGQFINLIPVFGSVLAIGLLGESLMAFHILGFALIGAGIWLGAR